MFIKICSCGSRVTTKSGEFLGRLEGLLWFNCPSCNSTMGLDAQTVRLRLNDMYRLRVACAVLSDPANRAQRQADLRDEPYADCPAVFPKEVNRGNE